MKYCLSCGHIISDNSLFKDDTICYDCKIPLEEDNMTSEQFNSLSELQKEKYTQTLYNKIKNSNIFNASMCEYGNPNFYSSYWFDKYESITGDVADRYGDDLKQHMQAVYGKNSPAYQQAIVEQCIQAERKMKQESSNTPKCPTCNSTNITRISTTSKVVNVAMFGLLGQKRKHQFKCKNCGYEW